MYQSDSHHCNIFTTNSANHLIQLEDMRATQIFQFHHIVGLLAVECHNHQPVGPGRLLRG